MKQSFLILLFLFIIFKIQSHATQEERVIIDNDIIKDVNRINVAITFSKAKDNLKLQEKFKTCIKSLLKYATIDINFFIVGDVDSQNLAKSYFKNIEDVKIKYNVGLTLEIINFK